MDVSAGRNQEDDVVCTHLTVIPAMNACELFIYLSMQRLCVVSVKKIVKYQVWQLTGYF